MNHRHCLLVSVLASALAAQEPGMEVTADPIVPGAGGAMLPHARVPVHTRPSEAGDPAYGTWAAGRDYKAGFGDGVTFVPYLGRDYPHNQPFQWQTRSVRLGEREFVNGKPETATGDYRVEYRYGGVTEAYDVRTDGLEQTFVIQGSGSGDLVVRGALTTGLASAPASGRHAALLFADAAGRPIVSYGAATAVDALGRRLPMSTSFDGTEIELRLSAENVAGAAFPLTVDPLLARVATGLASSGLVADEIDVGNEDQSPSYNTLFACVYHASAADADVRASITHPNFNGPILVFTDISVATSAEAVRLAFVGGANRWVIVYQSLAVSNSVMRIRAHVHERASTSFSTTSIGLLNATGVHDWRPDVGGTKTGTTGNHALIVFQREDVAPQAAFAESATSTIMGLRYDASTTAGTWGVPFVIGSASNNDCERPSVNQVADGGAAFSWLCVWQQFNNGIAGDDWDLVGKRVDQAGAVSAGTWVSSAQSMHQLGPVVAGGSGRYAVAFTTCETTVGKTGSIAGKELRVERFDWAHGAASPAGDRPAEILRSNTDRRWEATGIAADAQTRSHWVVGMRAVAPAPPAGYYARVGYRGKATEGPALLYYTGGHGVGAVACTQAEYFGGALCAYSVVDGASNPFYGHPVTWATGAAPSASGTSCGGATLFWHGPAATPARNQQIGSEFAGPGNGSAPANSMHFLVMSLQTADVPIVHPAVYPSCHLLVTSSGAGYLGMLPLAVGATVQWTLPLPETLPATTVHMQDWVLDPATNMVRSSARFSVPLLK